MSRSARFLTALSALVVVGMAGTTLGIAAGTADTANAACLPTLSAEPGATTAALVNPTTAQLAAIDDVDAEDCNVGIYFDSGRGASTTTIDGVHVHGATNYGVLVDMPGGPVDVVQSSIFDIGANPYNGVQTGFGAAYFDGATGSIDRTQIYAYQKNGVIADGAGTDLDVIDSVVRGLGPVSFIAQNGIQFSGGATGSAIENWIADHEYSPGGVVAIGLIIAGTDPAGVRRFQNEYRNNDFNEYVCPAQGPCSPA